MLVNRSIKKQLAQRIGVAIKHYRSNKNFSQEELAHTIGADRTYISALELGNKIASVYCLYLLCQSLGVTLKDLFNFEL